jgi:TPR repeat protein
MYKHGYGVTKDYTEAIKWYQKACNGCDNEACNLVEQLK